MLYRGSANLRLSSTNSLYLENYTRQTHTFVRKVDRKRIVGALSNGDIADRPSVTPSYPK